MKNAKLKQLQSLVAQRQMLAFIDATIATKQKQLTVHQQVWNNTLEQLQAEIIKAKSGVDLSSLLLD